jgi:hypothetical protein
VPVGRRFATAANTLAFGPTPPKAVNALKGTGFAARLGTMPGAQVTATTAYCGHVLRAEVELNRQKDWMGRCVVTGPAFNGTVSLYAPHRTPRAALDELLALARHSVDEERGVKSSPVQHAEAANPFWVTPKQEHRHDE